MGWPHETTAAGAAGLAGEMEKDAKYDVLVSASDALFYPLAVESFGAWTPASLDSLRTIATKTITSNNIPFSQAYSNLMQQLSVNLWKFNARMIESRLLLDSDDCFLGLACYVCISSVVKKYNSGNYKYIYIYICCSKKYFSDLEKLYNHVATLAPPPSLHVKRW